MRSDRASEQRASPLFGRADQIGALLGGAAGTIAGILVPDQPVTYAVVALTGLLTLVSFRSYPVAFALRCACATLALSLSAGLSLTGAERAFDVLSGGLIGILSLITVQTLVSRCSVRPAQR